MRAFPVSILHVTFSPTRPSAWRVTNAVSGRSRYCVFSGACNDLNSSALIVFIFHTLRPDFKIEISNCSCAPRIFRLSLSKGEGRVRVQLARKGAIFTPHPRSSPLQGREADSLEPADR